MLWSSWQDLARILAVGMLAYPMLVLMLRLSGKRTLSKMNAFDLVVTVAIGSTLAATLTSRDLPLTSGLAALALLIGMQLVVAWTSVRSRSFERLVKSAPTTLLRDGQLCHEVMRQQRVSVEEMEAAVRKHGLQRVADAAVVVLESDGSLSVISRPSPTRTTRMAGHR